MRLCPPPRDVHDSFDHVFECVVRLHIDAAGEVDEDKVADGALRGARLLGGDAGFDALDRELLCELLKGLFRLLREPEDAPRANG